VNFYPFFLTVHLFYAISLIPLAFLERKMKNLIAASMFGLLGFAAMPALADTEAAAEEAVAAEQDSEHEAYLNKMKCKVKRVTGSRLQAKKRCLTNREWEYLAEQSKRYLDEKAVQTPGLQEGGNNGGRG
jgi:hypothetical protein